MRKTGLSLFIAGVSMLICCLTAQAFELPDSGQTLCYRTVGPYDPVDCAGTGQDGEHNINAMSYTDNGNGTVRDNVTGLIWQKCSAGQTWNSLDNTCTGTAQTYVWSDASGSVCSALNDQHFGGYNDWRLPHINELQGVVNYGIASPGPTIDAVFANTLQAEYWSSTTEADFPSYAYFVSFDSGGVHSYNKNSYYVRCVRGAQAGSSMANNGDGTVTDNVTGLMWQKCSAGQTNDETCSGDPTDYTWFQAVNYCNSLSFPLTSTHSDWRLPNMKELNALADKAFSYPTIDETYFPDTSLSYYWSSTTYADDAATAWVIRFDYGYGQYASKYYFGGYSVRCVRCGYGSNKPVRNSPAGAEFDYIQDAYAAAGISQTIIAQAATIVENLNLAGNKAIYLEGGYDCDFENRPGYTSIRGSMTVRGGTLNIDRVIIK